MSEPKTIGQEVAERITGEIDYACSIDRKSCHNFIAAIIDKIVAKRGEADTKRRETELWEMTKKARAWRKVALANGFSAEISKQFDAAMKGEK